MSMSETQVKPHQWVEIKVTPIEVIDVDGTPTPIPAGKEPQVTVGCFRCNMGLEEGSEVSCPEFDIFQP